MRRCSPSARRENIVHDDANDAAIGLSRRLAPIDAWLTAARDAFAKASGVAPEDLTIDEPTTATILDLARIAAHTSGERTNAPLLSYLAGIAVARGADIDDLARAVRSRS